MLGWGKEVLKGERFVSATRSIGERERTRQVRAPKRGAKGETEEDDIQDLPGKLLRCVEESGKVTQYRNRIWYLGRTFEAPLFRIFCFWDFESGKHSVHQEEGEREDDCALSCYPCRRHCVTIVEVAVCWGRDESGESVDYGCLVCGALCAREILELGHH